MWEIDFISEANFKKHVANTIKQYGDKLKPYDLKRLNGNLLDPIKLIFDKNVYGYEWEEIVQNEIFRQRDKSSNNDIGYFHQKMFQYIDDCEVPKAGWDVIVRRPGGFDIPEAGNVSTLYVEMKNKHNTMNSASSAKTYMKMQDQLLNDDDCACLLVEAIAKQSQNIAWTASVDGRRVKHKCIRRVSMDKFYEIVTGDPQAFYRICMALPGTIEEVLAEGTEVQSPYDPAYHELTQRAVLYGSYELALYLLGFDSYTGFGR